MNLLRGLLPFVLTGAAAWLLLVLVAWLSQARLVYFPNLPGRALVATPADLGLPYEETHFTAADGVRLHGWFVPAPGARRAVLFAHGNAGNISHRLDWLAILHEVGLHVLLFDYRGYGQSEGSPDEEGTYRDARAAWEYLRTTRGLDAADVVVFGESLGAAVAARLARDVRPGALVLHSSFIAVPELAAHHYWFLPVRRLSRFSYATAEYVRGAGAPVLVIHSADDEIVPIGHGREVFARASPPKRFLEIRGDHNGGFLLSREQVRDGIRQFLAGVPRGVVE